MREYWNPINKVWHPQEMATQSVGLVRIKPRRGRRWDTSGRLVALLNMIGGTPNGESVPEMGSSTKMVLR